MSIFQNHIGVNLSSSKLQLVEVTYEEENFLIENVDEEYFDEFLDFNEKETKITSILQNAFDEFSMRRPFNSKNISFTLPHNFFKVACLPFDNTITGSDLSDQFKWDLSLLYPDTLPDDLVMQHIKVEDKNFSKNRAIVIATFRKYLRILQNFSAHNNLSLKYVDNVHIASDRLITLDDTVAEDELLLSVFLAGNLISVSFLLNYNPVYFKILHVAQAGEIIPALIKELSSINNPLLDRKFITKAFLGGDNISNSLLEKMSDSLKLPFNRFNPFEKIKVNPDLFSRKIITEKPYSFSAAAAIAFRVI